MIATDWRWFAELGMDPPSKAVAMQEHEVIRQQVIDSLSAWLTANDEITGLSLFVIPAYAGIQSRVEKNGYPLSRV